MFVTALRQTSLQSQFPNLRSSLQCSSSQDELVVQESVRQSAIYDSENIRFEQFVKLLLSQPLPRQDVQRQLIAYVKTLETNYNLTIQNLNLKLKNTSKVNKSLLSSSVQEYSAQNELEQLFKDSVDVVRRQIIKQRAFQMKKSTHEIEESILKLAELNKAKVMFTDFTNRDRFNLLDVFVNNEKVLSEIYK